MHEFKSIYFFLVTFRQMRHEHKITYLNGKELDNLICLNVSVNGYYYAKGAWNLDELNTFDGDGITPIEPGTMVYMCDNTYTHHFNWILKQYHRDVKNIRLSFSQFYKDVLKALVVFFHPLVVFFHPLVVFPLLHYK